MGQRGTHLHLRRCAAPECAAAFTTKQCLQLHYRKVHHFSDEAMPKIERAVSYTLQAYSGAPKAPPEAQPEASLLVDEVPPDAVPDCPDLYQDIDLISPSNEPISVTDERTSPKEAQPCGRWPAHFRRLWLEESSEGADADLQGLDMSTRSFQHYQPNLNRYHPVYPEPPPYDLVRVVSLDLTPPGRHLLLGDKHRIFGAADLGVSGAEDPRPLIAEPHLGFGAYQPGYHAAPSPAAASYHYPYYP